MGLGIAFLVLFLPLIAFFIASNFAVVTEYLNNALSVINTVSPVAQGLWAVLPSWITSIVIGILVLSLTVGLLKRILS